MSTVNQVRQILLNDGVIANAIRTHNGTDDEKQTINPSDVVVTLETGLQRGFALKSAGCDISHANPGFGTIEKVTKTNLSYIYDENIIALQCESGQVMLGEEDWKRRLKDDASLRSMVQKYQLQTLHTITDQMFLALIQVDVIILRDFIQEHILRAMPMNFPVYLIKASATKAGLKPPVLLTNGFQYILSTPERIKIEHQMGTTTIYFVHDDYGRFASLRIKLKTRFGYGSLCGISKLESGAYLENK